MTSANYVNKNPKRGDAVPTSKPDLLSKYEKIKNLPSPQISPCNSDADNESDSEDSSSEKEEGLVFDSEESDSDDSIVGDDDEDARSDAKDGQQK